MAKRVPPGLPGDLTRVQVVEDEAERVLLVEGDLSGQEREDLRIAEAVLRASTFSRCRMRGIRLTDVRLEGCDLANAWWSESELTRVEFVDCRFVGFQAPEARFRHVLFRNCQLGTSAFRHATFELAAFETCRLKAADFLGADLRGAVLSGCDLEGTVFQGAKLQDADFRTSDVAAIVARVQDLRGMIVDSSQLIALSWLIARELPLQVIDP